MGHADALCERTEGWAAGLVLAGLSLRASDDHDAFVQAFQGDDRLVVDYLTDEYLSQIDDADRTRMLHTAILDRMCGPLIDAVCGTTDGARWLDETARRRTSSSSAWTGPAPGSATTISSATCFGSTPTNRPSISPTPIGGPWVASQGGRRPRCRRALPRGRRTRYRGGPHLRRGHRPDEPRPASHRRRPGRPARPLAEEHAGALVVQGWIVLFTGRFNELTVPGTGPQPEPER